MKNSINRSWHEKNRMQMPTTLEQRVKWHIAHLKHCSCRKDLPKTIVLALKEKGKSICAQGHVYKSRGSCPFCVLK